MLGKLFKKGNHSKTETIWGNISLEDFSQLGKYFLFDFRNQVIQINLRCQSIRQWKFYGGQFFCFHRFQGSWNYNQKCKYLLHTIRSILLCLLSFNSGIWSTCLQSKFSKRNQHPTKSMFQFRSNKCRTPLKIPSLIGMFEYPDRAEVFQKWSAILFNPKLELTF